VRITGPEFQTLTNYIREFTGIEFTEEKKYFIENRLADIMKESDCRNFYELFVKFRYTDDRELTDRIIDAVIVNETSFFRDAAPFRALRERFLPDVVRRKGNARIRIWSAGCSTGQEPYSMAIAVIETLPDWRTRGVDILATDISPANLERAELGRYSRFELERGLSESQINEYFFQKNGRWNTVEDLRSLINFERINLAEDFYIPGKFDVIFIRNVLMYFDDRVRQDVIKRIVSLMNPDAYLLLGATENIDLESALPLARDEGQARSRPDRGSFMNVPTAAEGAAEHEKALPLRCESHEHVRYYRYREGEDENSPGR